VLVVNGTTLSASNLGDSGFVLVRDGVATFQCPQQQHNFNFPFQLGSADSMSDQPQAAMVSTGPRGCAVGGGVKFR
jgi:protein phosphatase PTC7